MFMNEIKCPHCENAVEEKNIYGKTIICPCGWHGEIPTHSRFTKKTKKLFKITGFFTVLFLIMAVLIFLKKNYGGAGISYFVYKIESSISTQSEENQLEMGKICNTYLAFKCSYEVFKKLKNAHPENEDYLANFIIASAYSKHLMTLLAILKNFEKCLTSVMTFLEPMPLH
jgi:hypothetical protein